MANSTIVSSSAAQFFAPEQNANPNRTNRDDDSSSFEQMLQSNRSKSNQTSESDQDNSKDDDKKATDAKKKPRASKPKTKAKTASEQVAKNQTAAIKPTNATETDAEENENPDADEAVEAVASGKVASPTKATDANPADAKSLNSDAAAVAVQAKPQVEQSDDAHEMDESADEQTATQSAKSAVAATVKAKPQTQKANGAGTVEDSNSEEVDDQPEASQAEDKPNKQATRTQSAPAPTETNSKVPTHATDALAAAPAQGDSTNGQNAQHQSHGSSQSVQSIDDWTNDSDSTIDSDDDVEQLDAVTASAPKPAGASKSDDLFSTTPIVAAATAPVATNHMQAVAAPQQAAPAPEAQFAIDNHPQIVTGVHGQLLPNGGTMNIRLDPPELGNLQVVVQMRDGVMSAQFQTSNEQATRLLSHSLTDLRSTLEASGVSVDRLHVEQAPKDSHAHNDNSDPRQQQQSQTQDSPSRRDQQRREMLQRMWRKLAGDSDPLDTLA